MMILPCLTKLYDEYVDTYREADGKLPVMMQLKRDHTGFVVRNAELIADGEGFTGEEREVALAAALLHDTGRYEQLKRYNTFKDSDSIDHAVFSHDIVKGKGWLDEVLGGSKSKVEVEQWRDAILKAVLYHNRRDLPKEVENPLSDFDFRLRPSQHLVQPPLLNDNVVREHRVVDGVGVLEGVVALQLLVASRIMEKRRGQRHLTLFVCKPLAVRD